MAHQKLTIQKWEIKLKRELGFKITKTQKSFCSANYKRAKG